MADYRELPGSPVENITDEESSCTRRVQCLWEDRYAVLAELMHSVYPFWTSTDLIAREFQIEPFESKILEETPGDPKKAKHDEAILTIAYSAIQGEQRDPENPGGTNPMKMDLFEEAWSESSEFVTLSGRNMWWHKYPEAGKVRKKVEDIEFPAGIFTKGEWNCTYYNVQVLPNFNSYQGRINDSAVQSLTFGKTFAERTLLCMPPTFNRKVANTGTPGWTFNITFLYNDRQWDKYFCPDWRYLRNDYPEINGPWLNVSEIDGETWSAYEAIDMTDILPPPPDPP